MLTKTLKRKLFNNGIAANAPLLNLIAIQNDLKLNTPRGLRIARAVLNKSINEN